MPFPHLAVTELPFPTPKSVLTQHELRPKRSFGQNFLCDQNLVAKIAALSGNEPGTVVEIGAGLGALTAELLRLGHRVIAIERDRDLLPVLTDWGAAAIDAGQLSLLEADAKTVEYKPLLAGKPRPWVLAGNLPYNLTGQLLQRATQLASELDRAFFLVQLEVAERLVAAPGTSAYGGLSVFVQAAFKAEKAIVVRPGAFYPQPQVDSAVVTLTPHSVPRAEETPEFQRLVNLAFQQRRKTLRNAWRKSLGLPIDELAACAEQATVNLDARGETLSPEDFARMAQAVRELKGRR